MIYAYQENKKETVVNAFCAMMDYAVRVQREDASAFVKKFLASSVSVDLGRGDTSLASLSGVELYEKVTGVKALSPHILPAESKFLSQMRALATVQWESGKSFSAILHACPIAVIVNSELSTAEELSSLVEERSKKRPTNLEYFRSQAGLSQAELAALSGVDIRSIQMYEQRRNDIFKAQYNILNALSLALNCTPADLTDENNVRGVKGEEMDLPADRFMELCLLELKRREASASRFSAVEAQKIARTYFYAYGYLSAFPKAKLVCEKGNYSVDKEVLFHSWDAYFSKIVSSKKATASAREETLEKVNLLVPANKKLTPALLTSALVAAISVVEEM